jgi:hypothetical protein
MQIIKKVQFTVVVFVAAVAAYEQQPPCQQRPKILGTLIVTQV